MKYLLPTVITYTDACTGDVRPSFAHGKWEIGVAPSSINMSDKMQT